MLRRHGRGQVPGRPNFGRLLETEYFGRVLETEVVGVGLHPCRAQRTIPRPGHPSDPDAARRGGERIGAKGGEGVTSVIFRPNNDLADSCHAASPYAVLSHCIAQCFKECYKPEGDGYEICLGGGCRTVPSW